MAFVVGHGHVFLSEWPCSRQLAGAPLRTNTAFRERVVEDRKKALNMLGIAAERLPRGQEVDNGDPLPRARSTEQAAALQLWAEFNSWGVCPQCKTVQPRELTPQGMEKVLSPWMAKSACIFCRNQRRPPQVPEHADFVKQVTPEILAALRPVECDFGPFQVSRDKYGRGNGYRVKSALVTFAWAEKTVEARCRPWHGRRPPSRTECWNGFGNTQVQAQASLRMDTTGRPMMHFCRPTRRRPAPAQKMAALPGGRGPGVRAVAALVSSKRHVFDVGPLAVYQPAKPWLTQVDIGATSPGAGSRRRGGGSCGCDGHKAKLHGSRLIPCPGFFFFLRAFALCFRPELVDSARIEAEFASGSSHEASVERAPLYLCLLERHAPGTG